MKSQILYFQGSKKKVCFSGIIEPLKSELSNMVELLGGEPHSELTKKTYFLVSNKISPKVIIAKETGIPIVNINYVRDIYSSEKLLGFKDYAIKPLCNLRILIFSNSSSSFNKLKSTTQLNLEKIVERAGGIITENIIESDYIIIPDTILLNLYDESFLNNKNKILSEQFISDISQGMLLDSGVTTINSNLINPQDYLYENMNLKKNLKELRAEYGNLELNELPNMFSGQNFYIDNDVTKEYKELILYCIALTGGTNIEVKCSIVNYVITNNRNFELNSKLNNITVVNPLYIIQCLQKNEKLNPKDFMPISNLNLEDKKLSEYDADQVYVASKIFKDVNFFILTPTYNLQSYKEGSNEKVKISALEIRDLILSHSGNLIEDISKLNSVDYVIANDGYCDIVAKFIEENKENKHIAVSHRFIYYCIDQRKTIKLKEEKLFHIFPMPFSVPYISFAKVSIKFKGFNPTEENKYKLIAEMIGAECEERLPVTHLIISEDSFKKVGEYKKRLEAKNYNSVKFVKLDWLLECCFSGGVLNENNFEVN